MESTERTILKLHTHQSLETKCIKKGSPYRTVVCIGGIRSGKSLVIARWILDRGQWDTAQLHAIVANTKGQLSSILSDVMPWIEAAGLEWQAHRQPPKEWIERWRKQGIKTPPRRESYRGILICSNGFHAQLVSLENRSYTKVKGAKWGSAVIEEVCAGATEEAVRYIFERVNCGLGPEKCRTLHHHVRIMHANPPDDDGHWIYEWLKRQETRVARAAGITSDEATDDYPCLLRGIGDTIFIKSRTLDNAENLPGEFIEDIAGTVDQETAEKVLGGAMTRKKHGRAYNAFDRKNIYPIAYDPDRTLYVFFDYNTNPTVAGLAHPLREGEFPSEFLIDGASYEGVFGEFFHVGGMDAHQLALALARGEKSSHGYVPSNWQGIAHHRGPVVAFGDAKGGAKRSMTGFTPWSIVGEVLREAAPGRYSQRVGTENPLQQIRIRSLNARFCNSRGIRFLFIDPHLEQLLLDIDTVITNPDGTIKKPGGPRPGTKFWWRTHISDGLGYMECDLHPMGREIEKSTKVVEVSREKQLHRPRVM
jgi:hypothetical protein